MALTPQLMQEVEPVNKAVKMLMLRGDRTRQGGNAEQNNGQPRQNYGGEQEYRQPRQEYRRAEQEYREPEQRYRAPMPYMPEPYMPAEQKWYSETPIRVPRQGYELYERGPMREGNRTGPQRRNEPRQESIPPYWEQPWRKEPDEMPEDRGGYWPAEGEEERPESRMVGFGDREPQSRRQPRTRTGRFKRVRNGPDQEDEDEWDEEDQMERGKVMSMPQKMDEKTAREWTARMKNEDGTKGPHWTMEQTKQFAQQKGVTADPLEFWVAMNMMYSDYCAAAKKLQMNTVDFYVMLAQAFLEDKDAGEGKLMKYYRCIVK